MLSVHTGRLWGVINALRIHSLPCCTMLLCQGRTLAPGRLQSGARNTLPSLCRTRQRDRDSVFLVGRVRGCAAASYLQGEAVFGCGSAAGRGQESGGSQAWPPPAWSPSAGSAAEEPSLLCPPGRRGSPVLEVRGDGAWPAVRSPDSLGIAGGAWLSLRAAFPAGAPA